MSDQFDDNVAGKKPNTREAKMVPKRPWDVPKPAAAERPVATEPTPQEPEDSARRADDVLVASDDTLLIDNENLDIFDEIKQLEAQMVSTLSLKTGLEDELSQARHQVDDLSVEANELEGRIDTLRTHEELERQLNTAQSQRDSAMDRLGELESRLESTIATRAALQADMEGVRGTLENAVQDNNSLSQRLEEEMGHTKELERQSDRAMAENERLRERVRQLEIIKETQEANLAAARAAMKNIKQRLSDSAVRARLHR